MGVGGRSGQRQAPALHPPVSTMAATVPACAASRHHQSILPLSPERQTAGSGLQASFGPRQGDCRPPAPTPRPSGGTGLAGHSPPQQPLPRGEDAGPTEPREDRRSPPYSHPTGSGLIRSTRAVGEERIWFHSCRCPRVGRGPEAQERGRASTNKGSLYSTEMRCIPFRGGRWTRGATRPGGARVFEGLGAVRRAWGLPDPPLSRGPGLVASVRAV